MTRKAISLIRNQKRKQKRRSKQRQLKQKLPAIEYKPDVHCGVINSNGIPCTRVITCHVHKILEKQAVGGRSETVRNLIKKAKISAASANASRLKGFAYDPDRHCGVPNFEGYPCMKVITCNTHLMPEKKAVQGRSKALEELLKMYKTCLANASKSNQQRNSQLKEWKKKFNTKLYYNPDKNCGVLDAQALPCLRVVTCDIHKISQKREVPGRSKTIEALIKHHKLVREKRTPKLTLPTNAGPVLNLPIKMILPKKNNNSGESTSSQARPQAKEEQILGEGTSDNVDPSITPGSKLASFILREKLESKRSSGNPMRTYSRRVKENTSLLQPAEAPETVIENSTELQEQVPIANEEANLQEQLFPMQDQQVNLQALQVPIMEEAVNLPELDQNTNLLFPIPGNLIPAHPINVAESSQHVPELTEPYSMSPEDSERLQDLSEFLEADFGIINNNTLVQQEPVASTSQNINQNSNIDIFSSMSEGTVTLYPDSPESYPLLPDFIQSQGGFVPPHPRGSVYTESPIDFPDELVDANPVPIDEIDALLDSELLAPPIESFQPMEELVFPMPSESVVNYAAPMDYYSIPLEEIEMFRSLPDSLLSDSLISDSLTSDSLISDALISDLTAAMFTSSQQEEMESFPATDELENQIFFDQLQTFENDI